MKSSVHLLPIINFFLGYQFVVVAAFQTAVVDVSLLVQELPVSMAKIPPSPMSKVFLVTLVAALLCFKGKEMILSL